MKPPGRAQEYSFVVEVTKLVPLRIVEDKLQVVLCRTLGLLDIEGVFLDAGSSGMLYCSAGKFVVYPFGHPYEARPSLCNFTGVWAREGAAHGLNTIATLMGPNVPLCLE